MNTDDELDNSYDLAMWLINFEFQDPRNRHMTYRKLARIYATKIEAYTESQVMEAFEFGYSLASDNIHNEVLYYLADTRRKTVDWKWLKDRLPRTEFGDKEASYLDRLAQLKGDSNE